ALGGLVLDLEPPPDPVTTDHCRNGKGWTGKAKASLAAGARARSDGAAAGLARAGAVEPRDHPEREPARRRRRGHVVESPGAARALELFLGERTDRVELLGHAVLLRPHARSSSVPLEWWGRLLRTHGRDGEELSAGERERHVAALERDVVVHARGVERDV